MKPLISLINSASAFGLKQTSEIARELNVDFVDLYAFMQKDLELLWPTSRISAGIPRNAVYEMAAAPLDAEEIMRVGDKVIEQVFPAKIAVLATFIAEITSPHANLLASSSATKALIFLIHLATYLHAQGHPIDTIEVVGGSSVDGLWRGRSRAGAESYVVNRLDDASSLTRLAQRLMPLAEECAKQPTPIRLALELEPGPLFNVFNKESLLKFCDTVESLGEPYGTVIGLNLDIPHWCFLASIDLEWVMAHPYIASHILHAHVSDHSSGHFCDAEPLLFHGTSEFAPWLRFLSSLNDQKDKKYSGFLTCELECCSDLTCVKRSLQCLRGLVDRWCV